MFFQTNAFIPDDFGRKNKESQTTCQSASPSWRIRKNRHRKLKDNTKILLSSFGEHAFVQFICIYPELRSHFTATLNYEAVCSDSTFCVYAKRTYYVQAVFEIESILQTGGDGGGFSFDGAFCHQRIKINLLPADDLIGFKVLGDSYRALARYRHSIGANLWDQRERESFI